MNAILAYSITISQTLLGLAMAAAAFRMLRGPRAQDRVVAFDGACVTAMLLVLTHGIRTGNGIFFEAAFIIALLGFISTVSLAKFLLRGEIIE